MVKRILAVAISMLLCIPLLGVAAYADSGYTFVTSADTDSVYYGAASEAPVPGKYKFSGVFDYFGNQVSFSVPEIMISYEYVVDDGVSGYMCSSEFSFEYMGVVKSGFIDFIYSSDVDIFIFQVFVDSGYCLLGTYNLTYLNSDDPVYDEYYSFDFSNIASDIIIPPEGRYNISVTVDGITQSFSSDLFYSPISNIDGGISFTQVVTVDGVQYRMMITHLGDLGSSVCLYDMSNNVIPGSVTFTPRGVRNGLPVLLRSIGTALNSVVQFCGFVINSLLAPDGGFSPLWPLIGIGVAFALVYVGVDLVRRFSP